MQSKFLHGRTQVLFRDGDAELQGTILRDDVEEPFRTIIRLDDGRYILSTECLYAPHEVD